MDVEVLDEVFPGTMEHFTIEAVGPMCSTVRMQFQPWRLRPGGTYPLLLSEPVGRPVESRLRYMDPVMDAASGEAAAQQFVRSLANRHPALILRAARQL